MTNQLSAERQLEIQRGTCRNDLVAAVENLQKALRWEEGHVEDPGGIWNTEHAVEMIEVAAKKLTRAVEASPVQTQPIGWREM